MKGLQIKGYETLHGESQPLTQKRGAHSGGSCLSFQDLGCHQPGLHDAFEASLRYMVISRSAWASKLSLGPA